MMKACSTCGTTKALTEFYKHVSCRFGVAAQCKKCASAYKKSFYRTNREQILNRCAEYEKAHREKVNARKRTPEARQKERDRRFRRMGSDLLFKIKVSLRNRLNKALRGNAKNGSAVADLGCSIDELKKYLEALFLSGMTWGNWGLGAGCWQIDHIQELRAFNLADPADVKRACHFTNLQPLWHADHVRKTWSKA